MVYGFNPLTPTDLMPLPHNEQLNLSGRDRAMRVKELHKDIKEHLEKATETYAKYANRGRKELILQPGDWVWVHMRKERFPARRRTKLSPRGDGPFKVLDRINNNAYRLELPDDYGINPTFNVADLSLYDKSDEEYDRLMGQPPQGGGDDQVVESCTNYLIRFPSGPVSQKKNKSFREAAQRLIRDLDKNQEQMDNQRILINFKIKSGLVKVELEDPGPEPEH